MRFCESCKAVSPDGCKCRIGCSKCGLRNLLFMKYCGNCGALLDPPPAKGTITQHQPHVNDIPMDMEAIRPTKVVTAAIGSLGHFHMYVGDEWICSVPPEAMP